MPTKRIMQASRVLRRGVQGIQQATQQHRTSQHRNRPKNPKEQSERHVERPQTQGPEEAPPVETPGHVGDRDVAVPPCTGGSRHDEKEADMGVVADGLNVAEEGDDEAEGDGEELDRRDGGRLVAVDQQ